MVKVLLRKIPGFYGYYAGENGEIYSKRYEFRHTGRLARRARKLKKGTCSGGYFFVKLSKGSRVLVNRTVHVLVALTWHGKRPLGLEVRHLDGDKHNNKPGNLKYGTPKENGADARRLGTRKGEKAGHNKLTEKEVKEIRNSFHMNIDLAKEYGVSPTTIHDIKRRRTWLHIK